MKTLSLGGKICLILFGKLLILIVNCSLIVGETAQVVKESSTDGIGIKLHGISRKLHKDKNEKQDCSGNKDKGKDALLFQENGSTEGSSYRMNSGSITNELTKPYYKDNIKVPGYNKPTSPENGTKRKLYTSPCDDDNNCIAGLDDGECSLSIFNVIFMSAVNFSLQDIW